MFLCRILLLIAVALFSRPSSDGATIVWGAHEGAGVREYPWGAYLSGTAVPGGPVNLSLGPLVQLWKAVGAVDDPRMVPAAYESTNWRIDDICLDEGHIGYGLILPPGEPVNGEWARVADLLVSEGDVLYVRAYNISKPDFLSTPFCERGLTIRNDYDQIVTATVGPVMNPQTLYFDHLVIDVPEPAACAFVLPGFLVWFLRQKRRRSAR